jgi:hypothetical protein
MAREIISECSAAASISPFDSLALFLTAVSRIDSFVLGKELVGEERGINRILRRLKLHAEGCQFGGQNS